MDFLFRRSYRGPLKGAILDWAGTTMDYGCAAPAVAFLEVFKSRGVEITMAEARQPMGAHKKVHIREISRMPRVADAWREVHGKPPGEEDVEAMFEAFVPLQLACLPDYADLVPGCLEAIGLFRERSMAVGTTTGYTREMGDLLLREAKSRGYEPDSTVCATEVPAGRPAPWMCFKNAERLGVYPMESFVKIGDTLLDIEEGLNAGMWTIGVAKTGNELGLGLEEVSSLNPEELRRRLDRAYERMARAGAHFVVDGVRDCGPCLEEIESRLRRGERP